MISSIPVRRDVGSLFTRALSLLTAAVTLMAAAPAQLSAQADLVLNVSDSPDPSPATGDVLYTISVENNGLTTATGVSYSLNVPSGARYRGATGVTCTGMSINQAGPATVTCALPNLAFNAVSNFALTLALDTQGVIPVSSTVIASNFAGGSNNSVTVQTTVGAGADVSLAIAAPTSAASGSTINYGITINNAGPSTASALRVQFPLPTGFLQQGALPAGCTLASNTVTCNVSGTIPSGGSLVVGNIPGKLTAGSVSTVTGTVTVGLQPGAPGTTPQDPRTTNNSAVVNVGVTAGSDVRLTKSRSTAGPYFVGSTFNFVLTPVYDGDSPSGLTMTDVVPSNYAIGVIASPQNGWTCSRAGQTVTCTRASGGVAGAAQPLGTVSIPVTVLTPGTGVTNTATITSASPTDPTPGNNTATDGGATLQPQTADLTISKSGPSPALAVVGVAYNYSLTAANGGPFAFFGTMSVTDTVPTGVTISAISATGWTCPALPVSGPAALTCTRVYTSGATLTSGSSAPTITLTATATQAGALTNRATVTSPDANVADPTPGNNISSYTITASLNGDAANLSVLKSANLSTVPAGEVLTYTLEVVNAGPVTSSNITLTDVVGSLINGNTGAANGYVGQTVTRVGVASAVTCSNASSGANSRTLSCTIPSLPACTAGVNCPVVELQIRPGGNGGARSNSATAISSTTADPSLANNTGSVSVTVDPRADVTITKQGLPSPAVAGQNLIYTLTAVNNGPSQAFNVTVTDILPLNVFFVSATPSTGSCSVTPAESSVTTASNRTVTCNLGTINNTAQGTVSLLVRPTTVTRGTSLINNASVTTSSTESASPGNADNNASTTIPVSNPSLDLQVNNVDTVDPLTIGSNTTYNLTASNNGPSDAENVVVTDTLPSAGFGFQGFTVSAGGSCPTVPAVNSVGGVLVCTFPRLASGTFATVTVTLQGIVKGVYQNAAVIRSDETTAGFDILPTNNYATQRTTVRTRADMQVVSKVATPGSVALRRPYTWLVTVRNNSGAGLAEADTVVVSDNLPAGSELTATPTVNVVSGTASGTTCTGTAGSTSFTCALGTVSSGAVVTISLPVRSLTVPSGGIATNTASVTTTSLDVDGSNNSNSGTATITSSSLSGRVFRDFNNNGAVDAGDTGIGSISMLVTGTAFDASAVSRTVATAADGTFSVLELPEGTYNIQRGTVSETFLTVGTQTAGSAGGTATTPPNISAITLGGTVAATDYRFAYVPQARLGLAKRVFGTPVANADGTITAVLRISARNYSLETLNTVNITDALQGSAPAFGTFVSGGAAASLTAGSYTINAAPAVVGTCSGATPNAAYTGAASTDVAQITSLAAATTCEFGFALRYRPTDPLPAGNYTNQANGSGVGALSGQTPSDVSHNGTNADPDNDGNPGNNGTPTPLNAVLAADVTTSMTFPATVAAGQPISGAVTYRNNGPYTGTATAFTMTLTPGLGTVTFGNLPGGATAVYNNGTGAVVFTGMPTSLAPNVIASGNGTSGITVAYTQNGAANSTVTSGISTTSNEGPNVAPNSASANITGSLVVDVTTALSFPATADAGTTINGTIAFRNFGPSTASGVTYSLTLATGLAGVTFGNLPGGATATYNTTTGAVTFAGMPASLTSGQIASGNGSTFITLAYTQNGVATSSVTSAIATSTNQGANAAPDNATLTVTGQPIADVTTSMAFPTSVNAGQPVSGTITLRNNGPSTAAGVTYSLTLTPGLSGVTFGNLPAGATATYNSTTGGVTFAGMPASLTSGQIASGNGTSPITLTYTQPGSGASTIASAIGTSTNQGANLAPDAASAAPGGALVADVRAQMSFPAAVNAGQAVVGTVRFGNDGPSPAATVAYTLNMTTGLTGVGFSNLPTGATASYNPATGVVTFTGMPITLASGGVASGDGLTGITVTYIQNAAASTTITATIATSTSQGANAAPDNATANVNGSLIADVTTALAFPASVPVGQRVSGTATFRNAGPSTASGLTYGVTLATGLTGVTFANLPAGATAAYNSTTGAVTFSGMPASTAPNTIVSNDGVNGITIGYTQPNALRTDVTSTIGTSTDQGVNALTDVATLSIDGLQLTDLAVTKVAAFTDAAPGDTLTYRIRATNNGPVALNAGSTLTDESLVGMTLLQTRCAAVAGNTCVTAPTPSQLLASATLPALAATAFFEVEVDGVVTAVDGGTVSNAARAAVPSGFLDTDNTNDRAVAPAVTVRLAPDLALTKTADSVFIAGRPAQYTLTVQNVGLAATSGPITISDPLPAGVTFVGSSTPNWACAAAGQLVTCSNGNTLAPNASSSVSFGVTLAQSTVGTLLNTASVSTPRDRVVPNNSASVTRTVLGPPDLAVTKAVDVDTLRLGGAANWTVTVVNAGGSATTGPITIVDSLPAGLTPTSAAGDTFTCTTVGQVVSCTRGDLLLAGATTSVRIGATLSPTAPLTPLLNTAYTRTEGDVNPANDAGAVSVPVGGQSVAVLRKTAVGEFVVGEPGRFRFAVLNTGTLPLVGPIVISDTLPRGLRYRSMEGAGWTCSANGSATSCTRSTDIGIADSAVVTMVTDVLPDAVPEVTNCANVNASGGAIIGAAARSCATVRPRGDYRLVLELTTPRYERELGDVPDFYVTIRNIGRSPLPDVRVTNLLPAGFVYAAGTSRRSGAPDRDFGPDGQPRNAAVQPLPGRNITPIADPANAGTSSIAWSIGDMLPGDVIRIDYRAFIRSGVSFNADNITISSAVSDVASLSVQSNVARTPIRLRRGVFDLRGVIAGKVYAQCDCADSAGQQLGDVGVPGVRVVTEDGTGAITDAEGKYNFVNVRAGLHVVKVDHGTLPAGAAMVALTTRNAGDGNTRFVDLKAGELHRADFAARMRTPEAMEALLMRRRQGEPTAAGSGSTLTKMLAAPMTLGPATPQLAQQAPVLGAQGRTDAATDVNATAYVPLAMPDITTSGNSSRATSPRRAAAQLIGQPNTTGRASVTVEMPSNVIPADGHRTVPVTVRVLDSLGKPVPGATAVTLETSAGTWRVADSDSVQQGVQVMITNGAGVVPLVAPAVPTVAEVRATSAIAAGAQSVSFVPPMRDFMAAGLLQGRIDIRSLSRGGLVLSADDDVFEDALRQGAISRDSGQFRAGVRGAVLLKGEVKGAGLLTLAFDSERDPARSQFRDITPDNGFQVFGDGSLREFDAQSQQRLYARLDRGITSLTYGDFATPRSDDRRMLLSYDRSMTGLAWHAEGRRGIVNSFAARNSIRQVVDELPSRGLSGPYYLSRTANVVNSERIEIITRDRNQPSVILARQPMTRFEEYTVEPGTGRVVFRAPVPSLDANLNPVSIRVSYEVDQGGSQFYTYGADGQLRLTKGLEVGAFAVRDENPVDRQTLLGVNATAALGGNTALTGEYGRTETSAGTDPGAAWRLEMRHKTARLEGRIFAMRTDTAFSNRSSTVGGGRTEFGMRWSATVDDRTRLLAEGLMTEDERTGGKRTGASVGVERRLNAGLVAEVGYRWAEANGASVNPIIGSFVTGQNAPLAGGGLSANTTALNFNAARARLTARVPNSAKASVFGEYERGLDASSATRGALGGEYLLFDRTRLYAQHEWISSQQGTFALAEDRDQQNTVIGIDADWLRNSQTFSEYRARDAFNGRDAEASIGLRNRWAVKRGVLVNTSFERVTPLAGSTTGAYAATGGLEWTASELWKGTARLEYRNSPTGDNVFGTLGYARKLSRDWTLLGRTGWDALQSASMRGRSQLGMAWRQTDRNTVNALFRWENRFDRTTSDGLPTTRTIADIAAALVNIQPNPAWTISTRYAAKVSRDRIDAVSVSNRAHLLMGRTVHDLSRKVDVGLIGSVLGNGTFSERRYGLGGELGYVVMRNLRLAGGYNLFGFSDRDFQSLGYTQRGPYLEFGFKFDETLFGQQRRGQESGK